jgi:CHRD domain
MSIRKLAAGAVVLPAAVLGITATLALGTVATASADPGQSPRHSHSGHGDSEYGHSAQSASNKAAPKPVKGPSTFLTAELTGNQEVPTPNGPAVGDQDGKATALVEIKGDRVIFALQWKGIAAPTLGHIHEGQAGVNGGVKVPLFGTAMPATVTAAAGSLSVTDAKLAQDIRTNPAGFYVNLHTAEFPGGAVRGQLKPAGKRINPLGIIHGGKLRALANGYQEVPPADGKAVGDPNGFAAAFVQLKGTSIDYSLAWVNIGAPTLGHLHQGQFGQNGPVKNNLFTTAIPQNIFAVSGTVNDVAAAATNEIRSNPTGFYVNLHTEEFPGGAVRGQLTG